MKKKIVAVMLSALTAGSLLLTGCGGGSSSSGDSGSGGSGGGDTLTVMCVGTEADTYIDGYNAIAEKFSEDNEYGVTVEIEFYENEQYKTKLTTLMASNAVPDIFFTWELSYLQPFVEGGKVADITSYLEEDQEWKNSFADGTLDLLAYDGKNYGVPTQKSLCVMFYNKQIFEENGVEVPTTYEEFLDVCQTLKDNGVTPMTMCGTDAWIPAQFVQQIAGGMAGDHRLQTAVAAAGTRCAAGDDRGVADFSGAVAEPPQDPAAVNAAAADAAGEQSQHIGCLPSGGDAIEGFRQGRRVGLPVAADGHMQPLRENSADGYIFPQGHVGRAAKNTSLGIQRARQRHAHTQDPLLGYPLVRQQ